MEQAPESVPPSWLKIPKPIRKEERADSRSKKNERKKNGANEEKAQIGWTGSIYKKQIAKLRTKDV